MNFGSFFMSWQVFKHIKSIMPRFSGEGEERKNILKTLFRNDKIMSLKCGKS